MRGDFDVSIVWSCDEVGEHLFGSRGFWGGVGLYGL